MKILFTFALIQLFFNSFFQFNAHAQTQTATEVKVMAVCDLKNFKNEQIAREIIRPFKSLGFQTAHISSANTTGNVKVSAYSNRQYEAEQVFLLAISENELNEYIKLSKISGAGPDQKEEIQEMTYLNKKFTLVKESDHSPHQQGQFYFLNSFQNYAKFFEEIQINHFAGSCDFLIPTRFTYLGL